MKNIKKVLSVVLAVAVVLSALVVVAYAHSYTGTETTGTTSIKYEVTQVKEVTSVKNAKYTAVNNDIYAVSILVKAAENTGIAACNLPIYYDNTKFEPMVTISGGTLYTGNDDFYSDYEITKMDFYTLPERYNDTKVYDNKGNEVAEDALNKKCWGMAHPDMGGLGVTVEYIVEDDDAGRYDSWHGTLDDSVGVAFVQLDLAGGYTQPGISCLNTSYGKLVFNDYLELITVYFKRISGVTEQACYNSVFGVVSSSVLGMTDLASREAIMGKKQGAGLKLDNANPLTQINFINGAVESPVKPLATLTAAANAKQQGIAYRLATGATKTYTESDISSVAYRFVAQISTSAFQLDYNETTGKINSTNIEELGFLVTKSTSGISAATIQGYTAAQAAACLPDSGDVRKCSTKNISSGMAGGAAFAFTGRIEGIGAADPTQPYEGTFDSSKVTSEYVAVPYIIYKDSTNTNQIYTGAAMTSSIMARYSANVDTFLAAKNAA